MAVTISEELKKELRWLKSQLPSGGIKHIMAITGKKRSYVSRFLDGDYKISADNENILHAALMVVKLDKATSLEKAQEISKIRA